MAKVTVADLAELIKAQTVMIAELKDQVRALTVEPKKPAGKAKIAKVKVTAGAGAPPEEEKKDKDKKSPLEIAEKNVVNWTKRLATNKPAFKNDEARAGLEEKLKLENAKIRKLKGETVDDEKKEEVPSVHTYAELFKLNTKNKNFKIGSKPGFYWDAENGVTVTGPPADPDEEFSEIEFNGKTYDVGDNTKRLYAQYEGASTTFEREDYFLGYPGIADFSKMKIAFDEDEE